MCMQANDFFAWAYMFVIWRLWLALVVLGTWHLTPLHDQQQRQRARKVVL